MRWDPVGDAIDRFTDMYRSDQGRITNDIAFTPRNIGNNATLQRNYVSAFYPTLDNSSLDSIQAAYNAETFGDLQLATDEMSVEFTRSRVAK